MCNGADTGIMGREKENVKQSRQLYAMIIPTAILFFVFIYLPMAGLILAFRDYDIVGGLLGHGGLTLKYFAQFFKDPYFFRILRNTVVINVYMLAVSFPAPIVFALLVNEVQQKRAKKLIQSVSYLPHFFSIVIVVGIMMELLTSNGLINQIIAGLGLPKQLFFNDKDWFRFLYVSSSTWQSMGWGAIIYFAALSGINPELYEAASVEGANRWQMIRYITIPCLLPVIVILFILAVGKMMSVDFQKILLMYNPGTYETADVIATYVYRRGILGLDFSYGTAVGLFNSVINFGFLVVVNRVTKRTGSGLW